MEQRDGITPPLHCPIHTNQIRSESVFGRDTRFLCSTKCPWNTPWVQLCFRPWFVRWPSGQHNWPKFKSWPLCGNAQRAIDIYYYCNCYYHHGSACCLCAPHKILLILTLKSSSWSRPRAYARRPSNFVYFTSYLMGLSLAHCGSL